jgi:hypothetical protein
MSWWKLFGLAAVVGVLAAGVAAQRSRRTWKAYDTDELRSRLHERLARAESAPGAATSAGAATTAAGPGGSSR